MKNYQEVKDTIHSLHRLILWVREGKSIGLFRFREKDGHISPHLWAEIEQDVLFIPCTHCNQFAKWGVDTMIATGRAQPVLDRLESLLSKEISLLLITISPANKPLHAQPTPPPPTQAQSTEMPPSSAEITAQPTTETTK